MRMKNVFQCIFLVLCSFVFVAAADEACVGKLSESLQSEFDRIKSNAPEQEDQEFTLALKEALGSGVSRMVPLNALLLLGEKPSKLDFRLLERCEDSEAKKTVISLFVAFLD